MYDDPIVDEVRKTREHLAEKHNFDVGAIFEDLRKRQNTLGKRLVRRQRKQVAEQAAAPDRNFTTLHPGR
ncbi:MAG: hypothetical protein H8E17_05290 [Deltaproteobacteria bacterium]|nr:hypothetical protein [Deltaproteobacteria bacterium]